MLGVSLGRGRLVLRDLALGGLATFGIVVAVVPLMQRLGVRLGLVDKPGGRRSHSIPTAAVGGLTILLAAAPIAIWLMPLTRQVQGLGLAAVVIAIAGVADDRFRLRWPYRLSAHISAA